MMSTAYEALRCAREIDRAEDLDRGPDRRERIAKLVREDREELVLVAIGFAEPVNGRAPLGDVGHRNDAAARHPVRIGDGPGAQQHRRVGDAGAAQVVLGAAHGPVQRGREVRRPAVGFEWEALGERQQQRVLAAKLERRSARADHAPVEIAEHDRVDGLLEDRAFERLRRDHRLVGLLPREVRDDQADAAFLGQQRHRDERRHPAAVLVQQRELALSRRAVLRLDQRGEQRAVDRRHELRERHADQLGDRPADHLRERLIRVEDLAARGQGDRALLHPLDHDAVGTVRAGQRLHLVAVGLRHDERVDLAAADRAQRFLGLVEAQAAREVGDDQRHAVRVGRGQRRERSAERAAVAAVERDLGVRRGAAAPVAERLDQRAARLVDEVRELHADECGR